ncbi:MAG: hypothetical protein P8104_05810, partial [Gammaproteobacteria bacterium]
ASLWEALQRQVRVINQVDLAETNLSEMNISRETNEEMSTYIPPLDAADLVLWAHIYCLRRAFSWRERLTLSTVNSLGTLASTERNSTAHNKVMHNKAIHNKAILNKAIHNKAIHNKATRNNTFTPQRIFGAMQLHAMAEGEKAESIGRQVLALKESWIETLEPFSEAAGTPLMQTAVDGAHALRFLWGTERLEVDASALPDWVGYGFAHCLGLQLVTARSGAAVYLESSHDRLCPILWARRLHRALEQLATMTGCASI